MTLCYLSNLSFSLFPHLLLLHGAHALLQLLKRTRYTFTLGLLPGIVIPQLPAWLIPSTPLGLYVMSPQGAAPDHSFSKLHACAHAHTHTQHQHSLCFFHVLFFSTYCHSTSRVNFSASPYLPVECKVPWEQECLGLFCLLQHLQHLELCLAHKRYPVIPLEQVKGFSGAPVWLTVCKWQDFSLGIC